MLIFIFIEINLTHVRPNYEYVFTDLSMYKFLVDHGRNPDHEKQVRARPIHRGSGRRIRGRRRRPLVLFVVNIYAYYEDQT